MNCRSFPEPAGLIVSWPESELEDLPVDTVFSVSFCQSPELQNSAGTYPGYPEWFRDLAVKSEC